LRFQISREAQEQFLDACPEFLDAAQAMEAELGTDPSDDWNEAWDAVQRIAKENEAKWTAPNRKLFRQCFTVVDPKANAQPLSNLSAGQRTMLALVADIAIKAVTQNNFLVPRDALGLEDEPLPRVLARTPGVVLIDELDVHLHPKWQRGVVGTLRGLFPRLQFIVTTHSQLLLGEVERESILFLYHENEKTLSWTPDHALGLDANRVLEDIMGVEAREPATTAKLHEMARAIDQEKFADANRLIGELEKQLGDDPELVRARAMMTFLEGKE